MTNDAAWSNAVACVLTDQPFIHDLARVVTNDDSSDGAARWLLANLDTHDPLCAFDFYWPFIEGLGHAWPVMRIAAEMFNADPPQIARFVAERIKAAAQDDILLPFDDGDRVNMCWFAPVTLTVVLADRAHDIAAFFSIGLKPNGSKDPYALRRAAKHFIIAASLLPAKD